MSSYWGLGEGRGAVTRERGINKIWVDFWLLSMFDTVFELNTKLLSRGRYASLI